MMEGLEEESSVAVATKVVAMVGVAQTEPVAWLAAARKDAVGWVGSTAVVPLVAVAEAAHGAAMAVEGEKAVVMEAVRAVARVAQVAA